MLNEDDVCSSVEYPKNITDAVSTAFTESEQSGTEHAWRQARNHSTVNTSTLNHAQHVLCDVSMLLGKCAQRNSPQPYSSICCWGWAVDFAA